MIIQYTCITFSTLTNVNVITLYYKDLFLYNVIITSYMITNQENNRKSETAGRIEYKTLNTKYISIVI